MVPRDQVAPAGKGYPQVDFPLRAERVVYPGHRDHSSAVWTVERFDEAIIPQVGYAET